MSYRDYTLNQIMLRQGKLAPFREMYAGHHQRLMRIFSEVHTKYMDNHIDWMYYNFDGDYEDFYCELRIQKRGKMVECTETWSRKRLRRLLKKYSAILPQKVIDGIQLAILHSFIHYYPERLYVHDGRVKISDQ